MTIKNATNNIYLYINEYLNKYMKTKKLETITMLKSDFDGLKKEYPSENWKIFKDKINNNIIKAKIKKLI
ncbi:MAG: hypothetical protein HRU03_01570 [Nanoarchaeales archaeon]|nr:hypothetical protein [Nanoarchaeales archaeon]